MLDYQKRHGLLIRHMQRRLRTNKGFSLLELIVSISIFATLAALSVPSFSLWITNSKVRTVAEALQNGINLAKAQAVQLNRSVQFSLTNDSPDATLAAAAIANGKNWMIVSQPLITGETATFVQGGQFGDLAANVTITGPATLTFTPFGRVSPTATFDVSASGTNRALRVIVAAGGDVRLCDPAKLITASPDGCP